MSSGIDDLLDSLDENDETNEQVTTQVDSKPFTELRSHARKLEKQLRTQERELEELRSFRDERVYLERTAKIESTFKDVGFNPKHGKLWGALNPETEVTPEAVATFAAEYGLVTESGAEVEAPAPPQFAPTISSSSNPATETKISRVEFQQLYASDPASAIKLLEAGRVDTVVPDFPRPLG